MVELQNELVLERHQFEEIAKSKFGNISVFLFMFGGFGLIGSSDLTDTALLIAIGAGIIGMRIFAFLLKKIAKTSVNPINLVSKGDIGSVVYGVTHEKPGIVMVTRKDGILTSVIAKGAFPHDNFDANERGYIWGIQNEVYLLTKGNIDRLEKKKKAMDSKGNS